MRDARRSVAAPRSRRAPPRCGLIVGMLLACVTAQVEAQRFNLGKDHACAIMTGGFIKCWGYNEYGQLGLGDIVNRGDGPDEMGDKLDAVDLGPGRTAKIIGAGAHHTCAVLDDDSVKCWGVNNYGQLGLGDTAKRGNGPGEMGDKLDAVNLGPGRTAKMISAGGEHTCAVLDDDSVKCWGRSKYGQLGLGDTSTRGNGPGEMGDKLDAVNLGTGRTAKTISAGEYHTCAVLDDDSVKCWGMNDGGQLGLGHTSHRGAGSDHMGDNLPAVDLGTGRTAKTISAGEYHTCAVLDDDSVKCWGWSIRGQLGLGDKSFRGNGPGQMGDNLPAVDLGPGRTAKIIGAGLYHTCAVLDDDSVKCWGKNGHGQLGLGHKGDRGGGPDQMGDNLPAVDLGPGRAAKIIGVGAHHTCALLDDYSLKCWGRNDQGQLGLGHTSNRGDGPGEMGDNLPAVMFGERLNMDPLPYSVRTHPCGCMASLGFNVDPSECAANGRSTRDNTTSGICPNDGEPALARAPRAPRASKPRSSSRGTFAIVPDLSPRTCANEEAGAVVFSLVDDDATDDLPDKQGDLARGFTRANAFYVGNEALEKLDVVSAKMCVERSKRDGELTCVKSCVDIVDSDFAYAGQTPPFGSATKKAIWAMTGQVDHPPNGAFHVAAPGAWSCSETAPVIARGEDGTASASANWFVAGEGVALRRGGSTDELFFPSGACAGAIEWDSFYVVVNATNPPGFLPRRFGFGDHLCARDGTTCAPPSPAPPPPPWARLSTSDQFACALLDGGVIKCWGYNEYGQLGLGDTSNRGTSAEQMGDKLDAVNLGPGRAAKMIGAGRYHACAVLDDDSVKCWGKGNYGQLGLGDTWTRGGGPDDMGDNLLAVDTNRTAQMISAGYHHTCAVLDDDSVKCWGYNFYGQLGLGDTENRGTSADQMGDNLDAVNLGPGRTAKMIGAGAYHTCAVLDDDSVKCWGMNGHGQLGLGDTAKRGASADEMGDNLPVVDFGTYVDEYGRSLRVIS